MKALTRPGALILMRIPSLAFLILFLPVSIYSQKIRSEEITYSYSKPPLQPLDPSIKNYSARIDAPYEEKNKQLLAAYEVAKQEAKQKYDKAMVSYDYAVKQAEETYEKDLAAYNKRSTGNKPVKYEPTHPSVEPVPKPALKTSYDYPVLASTYLHLGGYENNAANAVQVIVTLYGFDYTQPRVLSVQKDMVSYKDGKTTTYKAPYYHVEYSYRHPMSVKVILPDGKELLNMTPQALNIYKMYRSGDTDKMPAVNEEAMIRTSEEKLIQQNLKYIDSIINDKYGYGKAERKARLYFVKERGDEYADLVGAFNTASSGFTLFDKDPETAKKGLQNAIAAWNTILKESEPSNKKARIDKDVTIAIYFNLLEAHFALGQDEEGMAALQKLNAISLSSSERSDKADFEMLFADMRKRKGKGQ